MELIKTDHLLVSGHSWTTGKDWIGEIYDYGKITNLSYPGAGNKYIAESVMERLMQDQSITHVFVCWSGLLRIDIPLPKKLRPPWHDIKTKGETDSSIYYSNVMAPWRDKAVALDVETELVRMVYQEKDYRTVKTQSLLSVINLQNFLKVRKMDYRFSFMYEYTNPDFDHNHLTQESSVPGFSTLGSAPVGSSSLNEIDRSNVLGPAGLDWAMKQNEDLFTDGVHLTEEGYRKWAKELLKSNNE